jgi:heme iron utilization protein
MSAHADPRPSPPPAVPDAPEPSYAERARTLVQQGRSGVLSTLSRRHPGHPFGSLMPYVLDAAGRPVFLISALAMHTQNLEADPRASLFVAEPSADEDPLAVGRVTVVGSAQRMASAELAAARGLYLDRHPNAVHWVDFGDFAFWSLDVRDVYFVGGFGAMGWLEARDYAVARPDPLGEAAPDILAHMNQDHADALLTYARVLAREDAEEARMTAVDRLGFKLRLRTGSRFRVCRIAFPEEVTSPGRCREVLIQMLKECRRLA